MDISLTSWKIESNTINVNEPEAHKAATLEEPNGDPILLMLVMVASSNPVEKICQRLAGSQIDIADGICGG